MKAPLSFLSKFDFVGVFALRVGLGAIVAVQGFAPFIGGAKTWKDVGRGLANVGLDQPNLFLVFGLISVMLQVFGGFCIVVGLFTRLTALMLSVVVAIHTAGLFNTDAPLLHILIGAQITLAFFSLLLIGPGRFSLDRRGV
ncbi:MAG: DoxX family protein [Verrucomicrobiota bacterium]